MSATPTTRHYPRAIATLIGTIIGVGIFGVPYLIARSGVAIGLAHFAIITAAILLAHLAYGELTLRTSAQHRLVGYAGQYLGQWGKGIASISTVLGMYGALLAYLIVSGSFLHQLVGLMIGGTPWLYSVFFGLIGVAAIAFGLRLIEELEFILTAFLFIVMALIFIVGSQRINFAHWETVNLAQWFLPYGAILFSLGGASAITEIRDMLRGRERLLSRAIVWGTLIAAALTAAFALVVIGVSGSATSPEAIAGLAPMLGRSIVVLGACLGFLAIATSFLTLGFYLKEVFNLDFQLSKPGALVASIGVPFFIFLLGNPNFTQVIIITGAIFGGLDGILILITALRARKLGDRTPEFMVRAPAIVYYLVALLFFVGIGTTMYELLK